MIKVRITLVSYLIFLILLTSCSGGGGDSQEVDLTNNYILRWNQIAIDTSGIDHEFNANGEQLGPTRASRAMAIVHIAMVETLNFITPKFTSYIGVNSTLDVTSLNGEVAVAKAARDTLVFLYPSQTSRFDSFFLEAVTEAGVLSDTVRENSINFGASVASLVIERRTGDASELSTDATDSAFEFSPLPGRWREDPFNPELIPLGTTWGLVTPFVINSSDQFRAPPPPALISTEYAKAYAEVLSIGGDGVQTPTERTAEQTQIGIFWAYDGTPSLCAPPRLYNQLTKEIIRVKGPVDNLEVAQLLALVNTAMADAAISIWEAKYFHDFWRPVTAIQEADAGTGPTGQGDGNGLTFGDPTYKPLGAPASNLAANNFTPPFPTYPSGHAGFGGALFETLRRFYGTDDIAFSFISDEFNGTTTSSDGTVRPVVKRDFTSLSQAEEENGQSRVFLGIHFVFDKTSAITQGRQVGGFVFDNLYRPL